ncbi:Precursor of CEP4, partial [Cucurbita argyrosperma subsp. sororia]
MAARRSLHFINLLPLITLLLHSLSVTSRPLHGIDPLPSAAAMAVVSAHCHAILPPAPVSTLAFSINRYKYVETDAFRPTTPGHSPGVGHTDPPGRA